MEMCCPSRSFWGDATVPAVYAITMTTTTTTGLVTCRRICAQRDRIATFPIKNSTTTALCNWLRDRTSAELLYCCPRRLATSTHPICGKRETPKTTGVYPRGMRGREGVRRTGVHVHTRMQTYLPTPPTRPSYHAVRYEIHLPTYFNTYLLNSPTLTQPNLD